MIQIEKSIKNLKSKQRRGFKTSNLPIEPCESRYIESVGLDGEFINRINILNEKMSRKSRIKGTQRI